MELISQISQNYKSLRFTVSKSSSIDRCLHNVSAEASVKFQDVVTIETPNFAALSFDEKVYYAWIVEAWHYFTMADPAATKGIFELYLSFDKMFIW